MSIIELGEIREEPASAPPVRRPRAAGRPLPSAASLPVLLCRRFDGTTALWRLTR
ncbi:hypothetical protein HNR22_005401 [Micromonospora jinlongensis]|uniref:Uncharacterized protein n=1 Tax=Micromonospora jinlongensis TaxID=1287877 RepID=A0A7Z0BHV1_9ACTN|nr:hypothetical protein [Micromonospora jinlongensis]NYH45674.1 hypothetical protein [Micromonospora jinlongensis]